MMSPKMKFRRRRVSAVRDFPPFCLLNANEPTEEERVRINGERSSDEFVKKTQSDDSSNESSLRNQDTKMIDVEDEKVEKFEMSNKAAADEDDNSDADLFGEETEEEKKAVEDRAAVVKASGKKKESGKSSVLLDVK